MRLFGARRRGHPARGVAILACLLLAVLLPPLGCHRSTEPPPASPSAATPPAATPAETSPTPEAPAADVPPASPPPVSASSPPVSASPPSVSVTVTDKQRQAAPRWFDRDGPVITAAQPGQDVVVGQGTVEIEVTFGDRVGATEARPYIELDPAPESEWEWLQFDQGITHLGLRYGEAEAPSGVKVTLRCGLPFAAGQRLGADFAFTVSRREEAWVTVGVTGLPWIKVPYSRRVFSYLVAPSPYEVRLEFSAPPDRTSAEAALRRVEAVGDIAWESDRVAKATVDVVDDRVVLDLNGVVVPGRPPLAHQVPLVLVGASGTHACVLHSPGDPADRPHRIPLPLPLEPGEVSPTGELALMFEDPPRVIDDMDGDSIPEPLAWIVSLEARTVEEARLTAVEVESVVRRGRAIGWTAGGRPVLSGEDGVTVLDLSTDPPSARAIAFPPAGAWCPRLPEFSPDGRRQAWVETRLEGQPELEPRLVVTDLASGTREEFRDFRPPLEFYDCSFEEPTVLWLPKGEIGLERRLEKPGESPFLAVLDPSTGRIERGDFIAPDGKPLARPLAWTMAAGEDDWRASGLAAGLEDESRFVLVSPAGRRRLELNLSPTSAVYRAVFSPAGDLLAVGIWDGVHLFRCPNGEETQDLSSRSGVDSWLLGWSQDGQLWVVEPEPYVFDGE